MSHDVCFICSQGVTIRKDNAKTNINKKGISQSFGHL